LALATAAAAAVFACALPGTAAVAQVTERLPDLVSDQPQRLQLQTFAQPDGNHLLLRFDGYVHNAGLGAFEMRGSARVDNEYTNVVQRVYRSDGSFIDDSSRDPHMIFEPEDGHNHWHLKNAARYSLWNEAKTAEVAPAMKVGFCLIDSERRETNGPSTRVYSTGGANNFCGQDEPTRASLFEGVSAGWRDLYDRTLAFQWVDVSDVSPGNYWVRADIDPDDIVREINEVNPGAYFGTTATVPWTIPGYAANPVAAGTISANGPTTIPLSTTSFGTGLGTRTFRIIVPPQHGTLNVDSGPTFTNTSVVYTPRAGWVGPDQFTYTVHNSTSSFPRYPTPAAVTMNVGGVFPNVAISGAPVTMFSGTSARLIATVTAEDPYVHWTVDGIPEGDAQVGTVDPYGQYIAPASAPPSGQVTIRATTASGAYDEVTILIADPPPPQPAPSVAAASDSSVELSATRSSPASGRSFRAIRLTTIGGAVVVTMRSRLAGIARVRVRDGDRLLGRCLVRAVSGRTLTCRAPLPAYVSPANVRVVMTFRVRGKLVEVRRFKLGAAAFGGAHQHGATP
jgi:hypothetical protein